MDKLLNCKSCLKRLIKMVEGVPFSLQKKINRIMDKLSTLANSSYSDLKSVNNDDLNLHMQMERMSQYVDLMKHRVDSWKQVIEHKIVEKKSGLNEAWHNFVGDQEDKIMVHYTARWPLIVNYIGAICCFGFSTFYHLYCSHSKKIMTVFVKFDYAGICLMIAGSSTPPIYYAFSCPELRQWSLFYLGLVYTFSFITLCLIMIPYFDRDDLHWMRATMYVMTGFVNLFPVSHIVLYVEPQYLQDFHLFAWVLGCVFYLVGAALYIT